MHKIIIVLCLSLGLLILVILAPAEFSGSQLRALAQVEPASRLVQPGLIQVNSATPTATITPTLTGTITPTNTGTITPTFTIPAGLTPLSTTPFSPTATIASETPTFQPPVATQILFTGTLTPTATLVPFPTVTMLFPASAASQTPIPISTTGNAGLSGFSRFLLIAGLLLFWAVLIAWFWYIQRKV